MKIFVSQPMQGLEEEDIEKTFQEAAKDIRSRIKPDIPVEILSTRKYRLPYELRKGRDERLCYWSHALQVLSMADAIYLCPGWQQSAGCSIEANAANLRGIPFIGPEA